jgi:hypothetical protein
LFRQPLCHNTHIAYQLSYDSKESDCWTDALDSTRFQSRNAEEYSILAEREPNDGVIELPNRSAERLSWTRLREACFGM